MDYLDTSVVVSALTNEVETKRVQRWLAERDRDSLAISDWVQVEFAAALAMKVRLGKLDSGQQAAIQASFDALATRSFLSLVIGPASYRTAAGFASRHAAGLRAGDALHLAVAAEHGATLRTLDKRLAAAGVIVGAASELV